MPAPLNPPSGRRQLAARQFTGTIIVRPGASVTMLLTRWQGPSSLGWVAARLTLHLVMIVDKSEPKTLTLVYFFRASLRIDFKDGCCFGGLILTSGN